MTLLGNLNPTKALIFRISHRANVGWMLDNGLHCRNSATQDPNFVAIGDTDLIGKRRHHPVTHPPGGLLSDYVPFYFTPFTPMFYNIKTGWRGIKKYQNEEIVIMASSLFRLQELNVPFVFTDRHAYLATAQFSSDLAHLNRIDWNGLQRRDFKRDPEDPSKVERYEAETLVHRHMPINALLGIVCFNEAVASGLREQVQERGIAMDIHVRQNWYF